MTEAPVLVGMIVAAAVSLLLHLRAEYCGPRWQIYLFKPLTTALLLAGVLSVKWGSDPRYPYAIALGLLFSLVGDVFLMLPQDLFLWGLGSFLVAHLVYVAAFTTGVPLGGLPLVYLPLLAAAATVLFFLWPSLKEKLRIPILIYMAAILVMVAQACSRGWCLRSHAALLATAGALLFASSDTLLAFNRFRKPYPHAQTWIMTTYVAAQALIALSVGE